MLKQRVLTAIVIATLLLVVLFVLPQQTATILITAVVLLGAWEWSSLLPPGSSLLRWLLPTALLLLLAAWYWLPHDAALTRWLLGIATVWWFLALLWIVLAPLRGHVVLTVLACWLSLAPLWVAVLELRGTDRRGSWVLLFALAVIVAADTGAYFAGRAFGRIKLAPSVSPGKTWEGVFGGLLAAGLLSIVGAYGMGWPPLLLLPLALAVASMSVIGDLLESKMKRQAGVKDSGRLFPGHGGILDRIDSLSAGLPLMALGLSTLGLLP